MRPNLTVLATLCAGFLSVPLTSDSIELSREFVLPSQRDAITQSTPRNVPSEAFYTNFTDRMKLLGPDEREKLKSKFEVTIKASKNLDEQRHFQRMLKIIGEIK